MEKAKKLVIGASGLLAGPVIRRLDEYGFELRLFSRSVNPSMFINEYDIFQGDLFDPADLDKAMTGCDAVHISVSEENRWFPYVDGKYRAEQMISGRWWPLLIPPREPRTIFIMCMVRSSTG